MGEGGNYIFYNNSGHNNYGKLIQISFNFIIPDSNFYHCRNGKITWWNQLQTRKKDIKFASAEYQFLCN